jgi:hypothetical protein
MLLPLLLWKMKHAPTKRFPTFSPHHIQHQINIFITKNGYQTLVKVVINNLNFSNMVQHASSIRAHAMTTHATTTTQKKTQSYTECALGDNFIPLVIKTYGCFHSCFNSFQCSSHYNLSSKIFFGSHGAFYYYRQHVSITFQSA